MAFTNLAAGLNTALRFCAVLDHHIDKIPQGYGCCPTTVTIERMYMQEKRVPALADNQDAQYFLGCIHNASDMNRAIQLKARIDRLSDIQKESFKSFTETLAAEIDSTQQVSPYEAFKALEKELTKNFYLLGTPGKMRQAKIEKPKVA